MANAEREPITGSGGAYNGGLGAKPQRGPGAEHLVRGLGRSPPEAESFSLHK